MTELFIAHLIGDFIAQPKNMAVSKGQAGVRGTLLCLLHVALYTTIVCLSTNWSSLWQIAAVAIPHFVIDRFSLASVLMRYSGGRTYQDNDTKFDLIFFSIVYVVYDFTLHVLCLYVLWKTT